MELNPGPMSRRRFIEKTASAAVGFSISAVGSAKPGSAKTVRLFDGRSLKGWQQIENNATSLSASQLTDQTAFVNRLATGSEAVSVFLRAHLDLTVRDSLASFSASNADAKTMVSALTRNLNQIIIGPSIYDKSRFSNSVVLRPETRKLLRENLHGRQLARLNKLLLEDAFPREIHSFRFHRMGCPRWRHGE